WRRAYSLWRQRSRVHDVDVRARAPASAPHPRLRGWLRVVERVRVPRGHLALRRRRAALGADRAPPLLHARGRSALDRGRSRRRSLSARPARTWPGRAREPQNLWRQTAPRQTGSRAMRREMADSFLRKAEVLSRFD